MASNILAELSEDAIITKSCAKESAMIEVITGRLYLAREDVFSRADLKQVTVVVNLSSNNNLLAPDCKKVNLRWDIGDDVEEKMFENLVRYCAGVMKAPKQCLAIIGHHDTVDVVAACVLREYLGCKTSIALGIMRGKRTKCLTKESLVSTIDSYRIS